MIKTSVMYPNRPGARFDHDYYRDKHVPLIKRRMGAAMCHLLCDTLEAYQSAFAPHAGEILGDIQNFTDVTPVVQISEVIVENSHE